MKKFLLILILLNVLRAQDFGFAYYNITDFRSLGVSYNSQNFYPAGSHAQPDSLRIRFNSGLPFIEYREFNSRVAIGYQKYQLSGRQLTSFSVYIESGNDFPITGREQKNGFFIPLKLSANYVKAETPFHGLKNFDIGSLGLGGGAKYRFLARDFGVQTLAVGAIHFSNVGFGTEYGSMASFVMEIQFIFPNIIFDGLIAGYRYEKQKWNMNDAALDYERYYHGPYLGIFF
jgi:hypothetical protein